MWKKIFHFLASLRLAVCVILLLAAALAAGTIVESLYDIQTGRYWVYQTVWFNALLGLLGINILSVALSRLPWKRKHIPFLIAHLGILILLYGSLVTQKFGLDGSLVVEENERSALVELPGPVLYLTFEDGRTEKMKVPWVAPNATFRPFSILNGDLRITRFIAHAEADVSFFESHSDHSQAAPAIEFHLTGGPMNFSERFWLWAGSASWRELEMGPVRFVLLDQDYPEDLREMMEAQKEKAQLSQKKNADDQTIPSSSPSSASQADEPRFFVAGKKARLQVKVMPKGSVEFEARSLRGKIKRSQFPSNRLKGREINTGWMSRVSSPLRLKVLEYFQFAENRTQYVPSRIQYGDQAPPSAIELQTREGKTFWMTIGDRQTVPIASDAGTHQLVQIHYLRDRRILPFEVELDRFEISYYPGSRSPLEYSSYVQVIDDQAPKERIHISMNQPLEWKGFTLYQSSYIPAQPRPVISIFSVNQDPGRLWKYLGSILIVLGSFLLFAVKYFKNWKLFDFLRGK